MSVRGHQGMTTSQERNTRKVASIICAKETKWRVYISYTLIGYLCIHTHITYIVHDLGALKIAQDIQVMGSL